MLINPSNDCHGVAGELAHQLSEVELDSTNSVHCHDGKHSDREETERKSASNSCNECMSVCCHFLAFEALNLKNSFKVFSRFTSNNWPVGPQYQKIFIQENFRPPIFV